MWSYALQIAGNNTLFTITPIGAIVLFLPLALICFDFYTIYEKIAYQSLLFTYTHHLTFHIPHSTFPVIIGCVEHSGAQVK